MRMPLQSLLNLISTDIFVRHFNSGALNSTLSENLFQEHSKHVAIFQPNAVTFIATFALSKECQALRLSREYVFRSNLFFLIGSFATEHQLMDVFQLFDEIVAI